MLIDSHCHIYLPDFDKDRPQMILRAEKEGVSHFLLPAIDRSSHHSMLKLEVDFPGKCLAMMGLHPCSVKTDFQDELALVEEYLEKRSFIAVGEIGLDFYWDISYKGQQYKAFKKQVELALKYDLPVVLHSRNSLDECIEVINEMQNGNLKGVFHCFSGSIEQAQKIISLGFYLGIGGVVTFKNSGLDKVMRDVDLKNLVLETDAPYLAPVPFRGKRNESSYLKFIVEKLSQIKNIPFEEVATVTSTNAKELFRI